MRKNKKKIYIIDRQIILIRRCSIIGKQSVIETDRHTDRWIDIQIDRQMERFGDRQKYRRTHTHTI